jgi:outer membrane biosynthesis protein TonB
MGALTRKILLGLGALLVLALMAYGVYKLVAGKTAATHKAPKISLIPTTPPPPPPPPKQPPKPEPPKEQKEVKVDQPAPPKEAAPAPPSQELKMDGPAGDGPSAFSSGKITSENLNNLGSGGQVTPPAVKGLFDPNKNYATLLKGELQRHLQRNKDLRQRSYRVEMHLWVGRDGKVTRHELIGSSGDADIDEVIRQAVAGLTEFSQAPPERMPQPIRLLIVTGNR